LEKQFKKAAKLFPAAKFQIKKEVKYMKKALLMLGLLFFVNSICFAQESGNRIYGNQGYQQNKRNPALGDGNLMSGGNFKIEVSILLNMKPDSFVAVFGVAQEAKTADESNGKVNAQIDDFLKSLSGLGITKNDTYVDFITQNKIYDFDIKGDFAEQYLECFETKKTVDFKYKS
jgi:hypothetical protein